MEPNKFHNYEIMYIIDDKNEEKAEVIKKEFLEILTNNNGVITKEENTVRQFAQVLEYKTRGHYFIIWTKTTAENIADFNRVFLIKQKQGEVMRKMIINLDNEPINKFKERKERPAPTSFTRRDNREQRPRKPYKTGEGQVQRQEEQDSSQRKVTDINKSEESSTIPKNNSENNN